MTVLIAIHCRIVTALAMLAGAVITAITIGLIANVAARVFLGTSLFGLVDAIEMGLMAATFLAAPWVLQKNAHVAVDIVIASLPQNAARRVMMAMMLLGALISGVLSYSSILAVSIAYARGSMMTGVLIMPEWVSFLAPAIAGILLCVEFLRRVTAEPAMDRQQTGL